MVKTRGILAAFAVNEAHNGYEVKLCRVSDGWRADLLVLDNDYTDGIAAVKMTHGKTRQETIDAVNNKLQAL